jgi:hypothetical protein
MGTNDSDFPDSAAEDKFVAEETGSNFALVEGAARYPQTEMPEKTTSVVVEFLKKIERSN